MSTPELPSTGVDAELDVLLFELGQERFALPLASVAEVLRAVAIRRLPNAPAVVEGIIDVRGQIVPVLDVRARFGLAAKRLELSDHFLIGQVGARCVALRVDRALGLMRLQALALERAPNLPRGVAYVSAVASGAEGLVLIHDLPTFLSEVESDALEQALAELPAPASSSAPESAG